MNENTTNLIQVNVYEDAAQKGGHTQVLIS